MPLLLGPWVAVDGLCPLLTGFEDIEDDACLGFWICPPVVTPDTSGSSFGLGIFLAGRWVRAQVVAEEQMVVFPCAAEVANVDLGLARPAGPWSRGWLWAGLGPMAGEVGLAGQGGPAEDGGEFCCLGSLAFPFGLDGREH
jgi:hypothetical protein